jgi:ATPase family associated with various cellular activities (AAA)
MLNWCYHFGSVTTNNKRSQRRRVIVQEADPLLRAIKTLGEEELTAKVVVPFVEALHPGLIEYTHSSDEAGRDVISFGRDSLVRPHILCVQVKARPISHGARDFGEVRHVSTSAKLQGVTREDGSVCFPNEVWYLTSHPFPETKRRQVSGIIQDMEMKNIKFISGEEFSVLVREKVPKIASGLVAATHPHLVDFLSALSKHTDGRAFGLTFDRQIEDFYVTTAVSSSVASAKAVLDKDVEFDDLSETKVVPLLILVQMDELDLPHERIRELINARLPLQATKLTFGGSVPSMKFDVKTIFRDVMAEIGKAGLKRSDSVGTPGAKDPREKHLARIRIQVRVTYEIGALFTALIHEARVLIKKCPRVLTQSSLVLRDAVLAVRQLDDAVKRAVELKALPRELTDDTTSERAEVVRVKVPQPEQLLGLFKVLMIDGPPGCGTTTLLKTVALRLANLGRSVVYVSCADFDPDAKKMSLLELVDRFGRFSSGRAIAHSESVLVIDALDESAFDISTKIEGDENKFADVVLSCRTAYSTSLRTLYPMIALSPFNNEEREEFFKKWFRSRPDLLKRVRELVATHKDIDFHTRLPLIATILVALLENGDEPKTRADIYEMRLELLLSRWDRSRGVKRLEVDKPEPKRRFLRQLAFMLHSSAGRTRLVGLEKLEEAYEASLGKWGYGKRFEGVLEDLVAGSGLIVEVRKGIYSFGHLSFQEHLVGEHLAHSCSVRDIVAKFGDDWWREPLNFYACIKGDITEFASCLLDVDEFPGEQLAEMLSYAPYTSPGLVMPTVPDKRTPHSKTV